MRTRAARSSQFVRFAGVAGVALSMSACSSEPVDVTLEDPGEATIDESPPMMPDETGVEGPTPACLPSPLSACDIREAHCQRQLLAIVQCARGDTSEQALPDIEFVAPADFDGEVQGGGEDDPWLAAMALLGMLREPVPAKSEGSAGPLAYYDRGSRSVFVSVSGDPKSLEANYVLAHELVHVLQDRHVGLDALAERLTQDRPTLERAIAASCLIEGEAVMLSSIAARWLAGDDARAFDWSGFYDQMLGDLRLAAASSIDPLTAAAVLLPYAVGGRFLTSKWQSSDEPLAMSGHYERPLRSLRDYLEAPRAHQELAPCGVPNGYDLVDWDDWGIAGHYALLLGLTPDEASAWELATRARAATISLATSQTSGEVLLIWQSEWDGADAAAEFSALVERGFAGRHFEIALNEESSVLVVSTGELKHDREVPHELCP